MPKISIDEFHDLMHSELPWAVEAGHRLIDIDKGRATLLLPENDINLRPGGTISGPAMMGLADAAMYAAVLSEIGKVKLAVTTSFNINFLRKPLPGDLTAEADVIKLGRRLAVMEVSLFSLGEGGDRHEMVAHATGTYSIPPVDKP